MVAIVRSWRGEKQITRQIPASASASKGIPAGTCWWWFQTATLRSHCRKQRYLSTPDCEHHPPVRCQGTDNNSHRIHGSFCAGSSSICPCQGRSGAMRRHKHPFAASAGCNGGAQWLADQSNLCHLFWSALAMSALFVCGGLTPPLLAVSNTKNAVAIARNEVTTESRLKKADRSAHSKLNHLYNTFGALGG